MTLLEKGDKPKQVHGHHLVCFCKLRLVCLGLHKENLFTPPLHCGQFHCSIDIATIKIAEELYSTPCKLMHWHKGGLLGIAKPADQLVADIVEPSDCLKVIPDAFVEVHLHTV
jgi:hypothetical protein